MTINNEIRGVCIEMEKHECIESIECMEKHVSINYTLDTSKILQMEQPLLVCELKSVLFQ